jgi:hypothetical protein
MQQKIDMSKTPMKDYMYIHFEQDVQKVIVERMTPGDVMVDDALPSSCYGCQVKGPRMLRRIVVSPMADMEGNFNAYFHFYFGPVDHCQRTGSKACVINSWGKI